MTLARIRLLVALVLFLGWIGWLAYAVAQKGSAIVISRAQLTAATHLLVLEITVGDDGLPKTSATIQQVVRGEGATTGQVIEVLNLPSAQPPGSEGFPGPGRYFVPVISDGKTFRVAGLPRSPGYESAMPARPVIYPWNEKTEAQLRGLKVLKS